MSTINHYNSSSDRSSFPYSVNDGKKTMITRKCIMKKFGIVTMINSKAKKNMNTLCMNTIVVGPFVRE